MRYYDGETFSVGVECAVLRVVGLRVSSEQSSNARLDPGVSVTDLATNNTFARVRGGNLGHQVRSRVWVEGLWQLDRRLLSTETIFLTTYPGTRRATIFIHLLRPRRFFIGWCREPPLRAQRRGASRPKVSMGERLP